MFRLSQKEVELFKTLDRPWKIQAFLDTIPANFEPDGETCLSPRMVLQQRRAHCIEGAMLAALILRFHGHKPLIVDLTANRNDLDHVIAVFRMHRHWGAISKTNHAVLRYREPVYKSIRELAMSYFHEYFTNGDGRKTLRSYSLPVDLSQFDERGWMTTEKQVWYVAHHLFQIKHYSILSRKQIAILQPAAEIERKAGEIVQWKEPLERKKS